MQPALTKLLGEPLILDRLLVDGFPVVIVVSECRVNIGECQMGEMSEHFIGRFPRLRMNGDIPNPNPRAGDARLSAAHARRAGDVLPGLCNRRRAHAAIVSTFAPPRMPDFHRISC